jgi:CRP/FNR family transcriptional regulator, dissimilatory nitrate respiration regulator
MQFTTPKILARCPMFAKLSEADYEDIAAIANARVFKRNELIFNEGDAAGRFYVVLDGDVKVFKASAQGKEQILHIMRPFHTFAEAAVFLGGGYPASAVALHESKLLEIPRDKFVDLLRQDPELSLRVIASISTWLHRLVNLVEDLSFSEVPARLVRQILLIAVDNAIEIEDGATVSLQMSKTDLARVLGTAQETVSRVLSRLSEEGVLAVDGRDITILNAARLKEMAER